MKEYIAKVRIGAWTGSVPPRGSGWVRSLLDCLRRTHPLPRGGTDPAQAPRLESKE